MELTWVGCALFWVSGLFAGMWWITKGMPRYRRRPKMPPPITHDAPGIVRHAGIAGPTCKICNPWTKEELDALEKRRS
jgi:hypothetical protein